ncbi:MAG: hypothetical protein ACPKPY_09105 [Nitrososphaeraceae archaeon]
MNSILKDLKEKDKELNKQIDIANGDPDKILVLLSKRYKNYTQAEEQAEDPIIISTISSMIGDVVNNMAIFQIKKEFNEQIARIITRLDNLESKI